MSNIKTAGGLASDFTALHDACVEHASRISARFLPERCFLQTCIVSAGLGHNWPFWADPESWPNVLTRFL